MSDVPPPKSKIALMIERAKAASAKEEEQKHEKQERALSYQFEALPLILFPDQEEHLDRQEQTLKISPVARDPSSTGLGKTECYFGLAARLGLTLWIVCPAHLRDSVIRRHAKYSANAGEIGFVFSYYDTANNVQVEDENKETRYALTRGNKEDGYSITEYFAEAVQKGILLVFDEHHLTKNSGSARSKATGKLIQYIVESFREALSEAETEDDPEIFEDFRSRVYLCSATHIDKKSQTLNLLVNMGIVNGKLIQGGGSDITNYMLLMQEAITLSKLKAYKGDSGAILLRKLNAKYQNALFDERIPGKFTTKRPSEAIIAKPDDVMYEVTRLIIFPLITSEMPPFIPRLTFNAFFDFTTRESEKLYLDSLKLMVQAIGEDRFNRLRVLGEGLRMSQQACIPTAVDFLLAFLKEKPTNKVCLIAKYLEGILNVAVRLFEAAGYRVLFMTGKTSMKQRDEILFKFQQRNSNYRVLLFTTQLASGFDAHDLDGDFERRIVMFRDYSPTDIDQAAGRFYRRNMKSFGNCYLFNSLRYGTLQAKLTEILTEKSQVLQHVSLDVFKKGLKRNFPGFYPRCFINGYTIEKKGKELIRHDILYVNEDKLKDSNGYRMTDETLFKKFINHEPLPLVDAPLNYKLDADGKKRAVDETFSGLDDIYWLNTYTKPEPMRYERSVGTEANPYDPEEVEMVTNNLNNIFRQIQELKNKNKNLKIKITNADGDEVDDGIVDGDDLLLPDDYEEVDSDDYEEPEVLTGRDEEEDDERTETASESEEGSVSESESDDAGSAAESGEGEDDSIFAGLQSDSDSETSSFGESEETESGDV